MSPAITEIAPDVYRICVLDPDIDLQFNHFLVKDDEPLLFHTGLRHMWSDVREGIEAHRSRETPLDQLEPFRIRRVRLTE